MSEASVSLCVLSVFDWAYSPRGANIEGEEDSWDFGTGAGFYLNATEPKWANHYHMYDYVTQVSPQLDGSAVSVALGRLARLGHVMVLWCRSCLRSWRRTSPSHQESSPSLVTAWEGTAR